MKEILCSHSQSCISKSGYQHHVRQHPPPRLQADVEADGLRQALAILLASGFNCSHVEVLQRLRSECCRLLEIWAGMSVDLQTFNVHPQLEARIKMRGGGLQRDTGKIHMGPDKPSWIT